MLVAWNTAQVHFATLRYGPELHFKQQTLSIVQTLNRIDQPAAWRAAHLHTEEPLIQTDATKAPHALLVASVSLLETLSC